LVDINQALIAGAKTGNPATAKALFDLAGVYSLPEAKSEAKAVIMPVEMATEPPAEQAMEPADSADIDPVDAFFCSIGMAPSAEGDQPAESELGVKVG
jgi:hypothetical protein